MLTKENFNESHIRMLQKQSKKDPALLERVVFAFGLLEAIRRVEMPFIFKGGTCLILLLKHPMRLSTDIDIVVEPDTDVDTYISKASMVLCQEKVQVKRGLFVESMESYSTVFCDHVFQIIQFGYHLFTEFLNPIHDVFQQITQFCSLPNQCLHVFRLHPALPPFILSIPPLSPASHSNS